MNPIVTIIALVVGIILGSFGYLLLAKRKKEDASSAAEEIKKEAQAKAKEIILEAKDSALREKEETKRELSAFRKRMEAAEFRLAKKEELLDKKTEENDKRKTELEAKVSEVKKIREQVETLKGEQMKKLQEVASLSKEQAREVLLKMVEEESRAELVQKIKAMEENTKEEADKKAQNIIAQAIQKYSAEVTTESTVTLVDLPSDEIKGRIIGREGRNINAFEKATGIDVIVDDTPESIIISGFDLIRRYVAKLALEKLIADGRIHPSRIEEAVAKAQESVNQMMKEFGEKAVYETGVTGLNPNLIKLLGRLRFRTSYGQNVLKHSIEVAFLASALASEIGANEATCKKAGLLHDIGKAVDHEIEGPHALIGRDIAKKFGLSDAIVHCIEAHHEDVPQVTVEAMLVQSADAISSSRPGARRESIDAYIKRLRELENIAASFKGVQKSFAIQAGREVRVIVEPEEIDDLAAVKLANSIAKKIEQDLDYPGQIKVNVVRETRAIDFAK